MGGCTSSSEVVTDPYTGQVKVHNTLGGAPPALRRPTPPEAPIRPQNNQPLRFVYSGGGNALILLNSNTCNIPDSEFVQVTLPSNVYPGDCIRVQAPDGRMNEIVVPPNLFPGDRFLVRFSPQETPITWATPVDASPMYPTYHTPIPNHNPPPPMTSNTTDTFEVTVPPNIFPGNIIHVQAPNGTIHEVTIPDNIGPGGRFIVRIAADEVPMSSYVHSGVVSTGVSSSSCTTTTETPTTIFQPHIYVPLQPSAPTLPSSTTDTTAAFATASPFGSQVYVPNHYPPR